MRSELGQSQVDEVRDDFVHGEDVLASVDEALAQLQRQVRQQQVLLHRMLQVFVQPLDHVRYVHNLSARNGRDISTQTPGKTKSN